MADYQEYCVDADNEQCVDSSTEGALRVLFLPGGVAVLMPIAVGVILGSRVAEASTMGGIVVALFLNRQTQIDQKTVGRGVPSDRSCSERWMHQRECDADGASLRPDLSSA